MIKVCVGFCFVLTFGNFEPVSATVSVGASTDTLRYDSFTSAGSGVRFSLDSSDYWIGLKFTADSLPFTLEAVQFRMDNTKINFSDGCTLFVTENGSSGPVFPVPSGRFEDAATFVNPPIINDFMTIGLNDSVRISLGDTFWIVMGPVPGGPDTGPTSGWWGFRDTAISTGRSFVSFDGRQNWDSLAAFTAGKGNWVIRAVGELARGFNVVINELLFRPDTSSGDFERNHSWVELYNPGPEQAGDLVRMFLTNRMMTDTVALPAFDFPANSFLVVHFTGGTNDLDFNDNKGAVFFDQPTFFDDWSDACALFSRDTFPSSSGQIRDIVSWDARKGTLGFSFQLQGAEVLAHEADILGVFPEGDFLGRSPDLNLKCGPLLFPIAGMSVGRSKGSWQDDISGEQVSDFEFHGGPDAFAPTAGEINLTEPMVAEPAVTDPPVQSPKEWTLMLYMAGDGTLPNGERKSIETFYYDLLNQMEASLSDGLDATNAVVFFDGGRVKVPGFPDGATLRGFLQYDLSDTLKNFRIFPGTEANTSDSSALRAFISWAMDTFPANRYALAVKSDGWGWKGILNDGQDLKNFEPFTWMEMKDLRAGLEAGLNGQMLDLLVFDAPFMGQIEVATQMDSLARFMVASSEMIEPAELDYAGLLRKLENDPLIATHELGMFVVDTLLWEREKKDVFAAWATVKLDSLALLLAVLDSLAVDLQRSVEDVCAVGAAGDNFQLRIRQAMVKTDHFGKQLNGMADFIDLRDLVTRLKAVSTSGCGNHLSWADSVLALLEPGGPVIATRLMGTRHPNAGGLSVYFPSSREKNPPLPEARKDSLYYFPSGDYSYDLPKVQLSQLIDLPYLYAANLKTCYPHAALPPITCTPTDSTIARQDPLPPTQKLHFVDRYRWDDFLLRYYRPVADAGGPEISSPVNQTIFFDGSGSSDADSDSLVYFWDLYPAGNSSLDCDSVYQEDLDKDCVDGNQDDADLNGKMPAFQGYALQNDYLVTLQVWDSHDLNEPEFQRQYQTDSSTLIVRVRRRAQFVEEDDFFGQADSNLYRNAFSHAGNAFTRLTPLPACPDRQALIPASFGIDEPIIWETGTRTTCLFPSQALNSFATVLDDTLTRRGTWVLSPHLGGSWADLNVAGFFTGYFKIYNVSSSAIPCTLLVTRPADSTFLMGMGPMALRPGTQLQSLRLLPACDYFPLLFCDSDTGAMVAAANLRDLGSADRGVVLSTFGLEHIRLTSPADTARLDTLLRRVTEWMAHPIPSTIRPKGDLSDDCRHSPADVVSMLNCVFLQIGACDFSYTDLNCDNMLSPADVVLQLNLVFLGVPPPC